MSFESTEVEFIMASRKRGNSFSYSSTVTIAASPSGSTANLTHTIEVANGLSNRRKEHSHHLDICNLITNHNNRNNFPDLDQGFPMYTIDKVSYQVRLRRND